MAISPTEDAPEFESPRRRMLWIELAVVSLITWVPTLVIDFDLPHSSASSTVTAIYRLVFVLGRALVALFIVWTADGTTKLFGLQEPSWKRDAIATACLAILTFALYLGPRYLLPAKTYLDLVGHGTRSPSMGYVFASLPIGLTLLVSAASVFFEEVVFRAYFISRFEELFGNAWNAIVVASLLFGVGHYYEGPLGTLSSIILGVLCGIVFVKTRRLWPSLIVHFALNSYLTLYLYFFLKSRGL